MAGMGENRMKRIIIVSALLLVILFGVGLVYLENKLIEQETPEIVSTITLMLAGYKDGNAEQAYGNMVPVEHGGETTLDEVRFVILGEQHGIYHGFAIYESIQVEALTVSIWRNYWPLAEARAVALTTLTYENGCSIPYGFVLRSIGGTWKVYASRPYNMSWSEVNACIGGN